MAKKWSWTDAELGHVQDTMTHPPAGVAEHLGKTYRAVVAVRHKLRKGWERQDAADWSQHEDTFILANPQLTADGVSAKLPGRSSSAVRNRRFYLKAPNLPGVAKKPHYPGKRTVIAKTCRTCGLLLPGSWFMDKGKGWSSYCRKCESVRAGEWVSGDKNGGRMRRKRKSSAKFGERAQALTSSVAERVGEEYTDADLKILADDTQGDLSKALTLSRTYYGVASMRARHGYKSKIHRLEDSNFQAWSIDNPNLDRVDEITAELKREFAEANIPFPIWDWDEEDLNEKES